MKKKLLLTLAMVALLVCTLAICVSAAPRNYQSYEAELVSGEKITSDPFIVPLQAEKGKSLAQTAGSILTYAKRYSLCALLGIATGDDTDGNYTNGFNQFNNNLNAPALSPQLEQQARQCASNGLAVYQAFYAQLSPNDKKAIQASGLHNELKAQFN